MILVLNCGSQSVKWKIFDSNLELKKENKKNIFNSDNFEKILKRELKKVKEFKIDKIGHRVVHGGEKFRTPIKINKKVLRQLEDLNRIAPLHNPFNLLGIKIAQKVFPKLEQIAVFDTGFYADLPQKARLYALPEDIRRKYGFQKFGFHGISHEYAAKKGALKTNKKFQELKIITCHLGGGASITAVEDGKPIDTSMGFTPLEGLIMMTRSGDIDPGIILDLCKRFSPGKVDKILNYKSGIKGLCGMSDMREVLKERKKGNKEAKIALKSYVYRIQKYIGAYFTILNGCDLLIFTGAIGFGSSEIKNMICEELDILKGTKILAIEPNEELTIAEKINKLKD